LVNATCLNDKRPDIAHLTVTLCLVLCLYEAPPSQKAQCALIGWLDWCVVIGQPIWACFGNVKPITITALDPGSGWENQHLLSPVYSWY